MAPISTQHHGQLTPVVFMSTIIVSGLVWFSAGYSVVQINIPQSLILRWIRQTECNRLGPTVGLYSAVNRSDHDPAYLWCKIVAENETSVQLRENGRLNAIWALIGSGITLGATFGVWIANYFVNWLGFRKIFLLTSVLEIVGIVLSGITVATQSYEIFIIGRLILGFACGFGSAAGGVYVAEISPTNFRGALGVINIVLFSTAMLTAAIFGLPQLLGTEARWTHLSWIMLLPNLTFLTAYLFLPESPRWYFKKTHDIDRTSQILQKLRGNPNVQADMRLIEKEDEAAKEDGASVKVSISGLFRNGFLRQNIIVCIAAICAQRLTAYAAVYSYSTDIFRQCGLSREIAAYGTIALLILQMLFAILGSFLVDKAGRRTLLLVGLFGCMVTLSFMVLFAVLTKYGVCIGCQYGNLVALFLFIMFYTTGPASVPFVLVAEMFSLTSRQSAATLVMIFCQAVSAIVAAVFPVMQVNLMEWTFTVFAGIILALATYLATALVETKGKTFLEIQALLEKRYYSKMKGDKGNGFDAPLTGNNLPKIHPHQN
ncbi:solute carrier family 2, facilitated glucose transporter member 3-like [Paramacrobiotus metropolitanus]|uniref:solute carrier family 2, facilitated glucose transporter member 3-like n=1 Tax=Paramacrobiotus metropolitanus TaxID=2943436 RepID=UPI002445843A|nr:solute carrier family 2, facilitated glucose transporter member 3-like [Paramacrobiotus metropolitanus]